MVRCATYNCNSVRNNSEVVKSLLKSCDIVFLQELMLNKKDLPLLDQFDENFKHIAFVYDRDNEGINEGRPKKGVAVFYRQELSSLVSPVFFNDCIIGIVLTYENCKFLLLNVYLPCDLQNANSLDDYRHSLASIEDLVQEKNINNVIIVGDFNADPHKGRFWRDLLSFRTSLSLDCVDLKLDNDSFTYLCPAKNSTSWLDHILCTSHLTKYFSNVFVDFKYAIFDHFPLCFDFNFVKNSHKVSRHVLQSDSFVNWNIMKESDKERAIDYIETNIINKRMVLYEAFKCCNTCCTNKCHTEEIESTFKELKSIILDSTAEFCFSHRKKFKIIPGWNDNVRELHSIARKKFLLWKESGRPVDGQKCDEMKVSRSLFKTALKNCKLNEQLIRRDKLSKNLYNKKFDAFWKEVHQSNNTNDIYPNKIDGVDDPDTICENFSVKYSKILNKNNNNMPEHFIKYNLSDKDKQSIILRLSVKDIKRAVNCLNPGIGFDSIHSNHLKLQSELFYEIISMLFSSFIIHNYIPESMLRGIITPIIKDKFGNLEDSDNYRPVMSSSVFLKIFEYCLLHKLEPYINLNDRQHGFRKGYSTGSACLVLKETILNYVNSGSDVYCCFVDIKKAFDSVDHRILMDKLAGCGIPTVYVNLIAYWYTNQFVNVKYMSHYSSEWKITNGVRQGGVLSGLFFSLYIDCLLSNISNMKLGCSFGILRSNIIAYADDMVLLAPSADCLRILINAVYEEAFEVNLQFNLNKTKCMVFCSRMNTQTKPHFQIDKYNIEVVKSFKYLGYIITDNLNDKEDIDRVRNKFYSEFNSVIRRFGFADTTVKCFIFKQYCLQFYGNELWIRKPSLTAPLKQFAVGYHKAIKKILNLSYHESNHYACQEAQLLTFQHYVNKCTIMSAIRFVMRPCNFISNVLDFFTTSSVIIKQAYDILKTVYEIDTLVENDKDAVMSRIYFVQSNEKQMREGF